MKISTKKVSGKGQGLAVGSAFRRWRKRGCDFRRFLHRHTPRVRLADPPRRQLISVRHQHRYRHVIEQVATDPANQAPAALRLTGEIDSLAEGTGFEPPVPRKTPGLWPISTRTTCRDGSRKRPLPFEIQPGGGPDLPIAGEQPLALEGRQ
jgi:hypothetical protein